MTSDGERTQAALNYTRGRMNAYFHRAMTGGYIREIRKFIRDEALKQIRDGKNPRVESADIEAEIKDWMKEAEVRRKCQDKVMEKTPLPFKSLLNPEPPTDPEPVPASQEELEL